MKETVRILVVDDEEIVRESLSNWLLEDGYDVVAVESGFIAIEKVKKGNWNILLVDLKMPGMDGLQVLEEVKKLKPDIPVIIITAYATVDTAVKAMKDGAYDYLVKPFNPEELSISIKKIIVEQRLRKEVSYLRKELKKQFQLQDMISKSCKMQEIFELVRTVAKSNSTVLIQGESGTGKELLARALLGESSRGEKPFVAVSCAALTESLLESELFGHEKGAFTGAESLKKGKFEMAHGGTLFLDEIGDISTKLQLDLLRVLEQRELRRVGGTELISVDVRIIASTNKDLKKAMEEGRFRDDLYYRLNVILIWLPPLRERKEDIPLLVEHFLEKFNIEMGKKIEKVSEEAMDILIKYSWPGNVRELKNAIERAVVVTSGNLIMAKELSLSFEKDLKNSSNDRSLKSAERKHILDVLRENNWNIQGSAKVLGIDRVTLYNKIKRYKIEREEG